MLRYGDSGYIEEDRGPILYQITFSVLGVAIVVVILRLFCRLHLLRARRLTLSEFLIVISLVVDIASCITIHLQIQTGMGKHIEYSRARPAMLQKSMKVGLAQNSFYQALTGLIKTSILAQFHLLASVGMQKRVIFSTGAFVVLFTMFTTLAAIFQCIPMHAAWDLENFPRGCWNMMGVNFFTSSMNTLIDIVIFVLPLPTMINLHIGLKKKIALVMTFSVGLIAIVCSMVRLRNIVYFRGVGDFTYEASMVPVWGAIECNAGIICASFPFTVPLIKWVSGSITDSFARLHSNPTTGDDHELQRSDGRDWAFSFNHQSEWRRMPSESTENIAGGLSGTAANSKQQTNQLEVHSQNKG